MRNRGTGTAPWRPWLIAIVLIISSWLGGARPAHAAPPNDVRDAEVAELLRWAAALCRADMPEEGGRTMNALKVGVDLLELMPCSPAIAQRLLPVREALRARLGSDGGFTYRIINPTGGSRAEEAYRALVDEGPLSGVTLVLLDSNATGVEGTIYQSLRLRKFRATTGPDERIDTHSLPYCPACSFVPREEADAISVASWRGVLLHEARHVVQAINNPDMAADFAGPDGGFSVYAAFCEACADEGLNTTRMYRAAERMPALREAVGSDGVELVERACAGHKDAYIALRALYDRLEGEGAFDRLFKPFVWY